MPDEPRCPNCKEHAELVQQQRLIIDRLSKEIQVHLENQRTLAKAQSDAMLQLAKLNSAERRELYTRIQGYSARMFDSLETPKEKRPSDDELVEKLKLFPNPAGKGWFMPGFDALFDTPYEAWVEFQHVTRQIALAEERDG